HRHVAITFITRHRYYALFYFFYFNDPSTTDIYTLSLHDALPICDALSPGARSESSEQQERGAEAERTQNTLHLIDLRDAHHAMGDRKSTRLNSSHVSSSYAVFCLKKKKDAARNCRRPHMITVILR